MMFVIKGVNKQVLEINETQNSFFEKAIFFVKPEYSNLSEGRLRETAEKQFNSAGAPPEGRERKRIFIKNKYVNAAVFITAGVILGLVISFFIK